MIRLAEYLDERGSSPFGKWINRLNREAAAEVTYALARLAHGYQSNVKAVGGGVNEYKITFGSGYRIYFGRITNTESNGVGRHGTDERFQGDDQG